MLDRTISHRHHCRPPRHGALCCCRHTSARSISSICSPSSPALTAPWRRRPLNADSTVRQHTHHHCSRHQQPPSHLPIRPPLPAAFAVSRRQRQPQLHQHQRRVAIGTSTPTVSAVVIPRAGLSNALPAPFVALPPPPAFGTASVAAGMCVRCTSGAYPRYVHRTSCESQSTRNRSSALAPMQLLLPRRQCTLLPLPPLRFQSRPRRIGHRRRRIVSILKHRD